MSCSPISFWMGLSSGSCLFLASFDRSARRDEPVRILNVGFVKSYLVSRELLLFLVDFKVLYKEVIATGLVSDSLGLVVVVKESKDVLRFFVVVFPLCNFVVDAVFGDFVNRDEMGKGLLQEPQCHRLECIR